MIVYTSNEAQHMTMSEKWKSSDSLEQMTGADFMITASNAPFHSATLIAKHLREGAFLVQRKKGRDFIGSCNETGNLWDMVGRMLEFCKEQKVNLHPAQRIILTIGTFYTKTNDVLLLNGKPLEHVSYWQYHGAVERIFERGCVYVNIPNTRDAFYKWVKQKEAHVLDNKKHPTKYAITKPARMTENLTDVYNPALQELVVVRDQRRTLVTFPGMGEAKANAVWDYSKCNLARCLADMTDPALARVNGKPAGVAQGLILQWREWLGLQENEMLFVGNEPSEK